MRMGGQQIYTPVKNCVCSWLKYVCSWQRKQLRVCAATQATGQALCRKHPTHAKHCYVRPEHLLLATYCYVAVYRAPHVYHPLLLHTVIGLLSYTYVNSLRVRTHH